MSDTNQDNVLKKHLALVIYALTVIFFTTPAMAEGKFQKVSDPKALVLTFATYTGNMNKGLLPKEYKDKTSVYKELVKNYIPTKLMANYSIGIDWQYLTEEERANFIRLYDKEILGWLMDISETVRFENQQFIDIRPTSDEDIIVNTVALTEGVYYPIQWYTTLIKNNYYIQDIIVAEHSMYKMILEIPVIRDQLSVLKEAALRRSRAK